MKYIKLFFVYAQIILEARNIFILVERYSPSRMKELLRKLYRLLPEKSYSEEEFVNIFSAFFRLLGVIVDALWLVFPEIMHQLTWKYVFATQKGWEWFFSKLQKYAQESESELHAKIESYKKLYNQKVMMQLLQKDLEVQLQQFDIYFQDSVEKGIKKAQEQFLEPPPEDENWLFYIDSTGKMHVNPKWDERK